MKLMSLTLILNSTAHSTSNMIQYDKTFSLYTNTDFVLINSNVYDHVSSLNTQNFTFLEYRLNETIVINK